MLNQSNNQKMSNLAKTLNDPKQIIDLYQKEYKNMDLLTMFLLTGSNDVQRTMEMLKQWEKVEADEVAKSTYKLAQETLKRVMVQRVNMTAAIYGVAVASPIDAKPQQQKPTETSDKQEDPAQEESTETEKDNVIQMLPTVQDVYARIHTIFKNSFEKFSSMPENTDKEELGNIQSEAYAEAFKLLKETLGAGRYLSADKKKSNKVWDITSLNEALDTISRDYFKVDSSDSGETQQDNNQEKIILLNDIFIAVKSAFDAGKSKEETFEEIKNMVVGAKIQDSNSVIDAAHFETMTKMHGSIDTYYNSLVTMKQASAGPTKTTDELLSEASEKFDTEIKSLEKGDTGMTFAKIVKAVRGFFLENNLNTTLDNVKSYTEKIVKEKAPSFFEKYKERHKGKVSEVKEEKVEETISIDIYDDSHNYRETNPELAEKAKGIDNFKTLFETAKVLTEEGKWKDALSLVIERMSSGEIKVTPIKGEPTVVTFEVPQSKDWFKTCILESKGLGSNTIQSIETAKVEFQQKQTQTKDSDQVKETTDSVVETQQTNKKQGPVPAAGFSNDTVLFPNGKDHTEDSDLVALVIELIGSKPKKSLTFMVSNTEVSIDIPNYNDAEAKIDELIEMMVKNANGYAPTKDALLAFFSSYTLPNGVIKSLMNHIMEEAKITRQHNKAVKRRQEKENAKKENSAEATNVEQTEVETTEQSEVASTTPSEESVNTDPVKETEVTEQSTEENGSNDEAESADSHSEESSPLADQPEVTEEKSESQESSETKAEPATSNTSGQDTTSILETVSFDSVKPIVLAKEKADFNKAIGNFYLNSNDKELAKKQLLEIVKNYASDKSYRKNMIHNYRRSSESDLVRLLDKAIENTEKATNAS